MDSVSSENSETRSIFPLRLYFVLALYASVFVTYAVTWAFTPDEGYHLMAARLIASGKTPYIDFCFPQTPLNAYWNALWMRILGTNWHVPHFLAALFTVAAVVLIADYVVRRFPVTAWRTGGAIAAALVLNPPVILLAHATCSLPALHVPSPRLTRARIERSNE